METDNEKGVSHDSHAQKLDPGKMSFFAKPAPLAALVGDSV